MTKEQSNGVAENLGCETGHHLTERFIRPSRRSSSVWGLSRNLLHPHLAHSGNFRPAQLNSARRNSPAFFSVAMPDLECKAKKRKRLAKRRDLYRRVGLQEVIDCSPMTANQSINRIL